MDDGIILGPTKTSPRRAEARAAVDDHPSSIDRYRILEPLGAGGMGVVYSAYDPELDRKVAIKLLRSANDHAAQMRMVREAKAMARLSHPNVVQIYDAGAAAGQVFLTMELIEGKTLRQWLAEKRQATAAIMDVFVAAGRGLAAAHAAGLVHRDFKPDNVLLAGSGRVCVADFGIASSAPEAFAGATQALASAAPLRSVTTTGTIIGTPGYMAPEQIKGAEIGPSADQFALCVALYEALYGTRPFKGRMLDELLEDIEAQQLGGMNSDRAIPKRWLVAIERGLAASPTERYPDMEALLTELSFDVRDERRRNIRAGAAVVLSGLGLLAARSLEAAPEPCNSAGAEFAEVWSPAARQSTAVHLEETSAVDTAEATLRSIDDFAKRWVTSHEEMCRAHQDGALSAPMLDGSMVCLEQRRHAVQTVVKLASEGRASGARLAEAAAQLPRISDCTERVGLADRPEVLAPEAIAPRVEAIARELTEAVVLHDAGVIEPALEQIRALAERATALGFVPIRVEVALAAGRLAMSRNDIRTAGESLERASSLALEAGLDRRAAEAEARLLFRDALSANPSEREPSEHVAAALTRRSGDPPWLRALWKNNAGVGWAEIGRSEEARTRFEAAFQIAEEFGDISVLEHSGYALNLARHTDDVAERDVLFARATQMLGEALGEQHPARVDAAYRQASYAQDSAWAVDSLMQTCPVFAEQGEDPIARHMCWWTTAELLDSRGEVERGRVALEAAAQTLADASDPYEVATQHRVNGYRQLLAGKTSAALDALEASRKILEPKRELPWVGRDLDALTILRARALRSLGRLNEARADLEDLVARNEAATSKPIETALIWRAEQAQSLLRESRSLP